MNNSTALLLSLIITVLLYSSFITGIPPYQSYLSLHLCPYAPTRALCSSASKLLQVPHTNLRFGSRCFLCPLAVSGTHFLSVYFVNLTTLRKHL